MNSSIKIVGIPGRENIRKQKRKSGIIHEDILDLKDMS